MSILNTKKGVLMPIHEVKAWTNPDDLTLNQVVVNYDST